MHQITDSFLTNLRGRLKTQDRSMEQRMMSSISTQYAATLSMWNMCEYWFRLPDNYNASFEENNSIYGAVWYLKGIRSLCYSTVFFYALSDQVYR